MHLDAWHSALDDVFMYTIVLRELSDGSTCSGDDRTGVARK